MTLYTRNIDVIHPLFIFLGNSNGLFNIDDITGRIYLNRSLTQTSVGTYSLRIVVNDTADHTDSVDIIVAVSNELPSEPVTAAMSTASDTNTYLILGATLGVSLVIIVLAVMAYFKFIRQVSVVLLYTVAFIYNKHIIDTVIQIHFSSNAASETKMPLILQKVQIFVGKRVYLYFVFLFNFDHLFMYIYIANEVYSVKTVLMKGYF